MLALIAILYYSPQYLWLSLIGWILFGKIGGEIGLHRYFAHKSFKTSVFCERLFLILGALNCFGPPLAWISVHRKHHQFPDSNQDPHGEQSFWRVWLTAWKPFTVDLRSTLDLIRDPWQKNVYNHYFSLIIGTILLLAVIDPLLPLYLISIPAVLTFHSAGMVNAICHYKGYRRFDTKDKSYNNTIVNIFTLGSGLHNNHHAHPRSYRNSYAWYEVDLPGILIHYVFKQKDSVS